MVVEESFSLYHFHPIFEFFLTFYTAYLISDDLKKLLDKKFFDLIKTKFIDIIRSNKKNLSSNIELIYLPLLQ